MDSSGLPEKSPAAMVKNGGAAVEDRGSVAAETVTDGGMWTSSSRTAKLAGRVRFRPGSDCGVVGGYGFISTRGMQWQPYMHEILNG